MTLRSIVAASAACLALTALTATVLGWPYERAALLAPVLVAAVGAVAGLCILWGRLAWQGLRANRENRKIFAIVAAGCLLLAVLSLIGLDLPKE